MKSFSICFLALVAIAIFSGCAGESGQYTESQLAAQHAGYDPTARLSGTRY